MFSYIESKLNRMFSDWEMCPKESLSSLDIKLLEIASKYKTKLIFINTDLGFGWADKDFIIINNKNLCDDEKISVFFHELGHVILDERSFHISVSQHVGLYYYDICDIEKEAWRVGKKEALKRGYILNDKHEEEALITHYLTSVRIFRIKGKCNVEQRVEMWKYRNGMDDSLIEKIYLSLR